MVDRLIALRMFTCEHWRKSVRARALRRRKACGARGPPSLNLGPRQESQN